MPEVAIELEGENGCLPFLMQRIAEQGHAVVVVAEGVQCCVLLFLFLSIFFISVSFSSFFLFFPSLLSSPVQCSRNHLPYPNATVFILIFTLIFVLYL